jgi:ATP-dependent DNA ligase
MLARLERELPEGDYLFEPKWDGFRCLAFCAGGSVELRSRNDRPLARYFPEVVERLAALADRGVVLDGELVPRTAAGHDFAALMARLHPAASRVERLRHETPAGFVAFDVLAADGEDLRPLPFAARRRALERLLLGQAGVLLTPMTENREEAFAWLDAPSDAGIDGVVAKDKRLPYRPGVRAMVKVKRERTADCVVAGFRWLGDRPLPSSLLLGLHDRGGTLRHVGVATSFALRERERMLEELAPLAVPLVGHPWERGFELGGSPIGRLRGAAGTWTPDMERDWVPLAPVRVCEVAYDRLDHQRFRHPARFRRWRLDRDPASCTLEQLA